MTTALLEESSGEIDGGDYLTLAQALVAALQTDNADETTRLLDELTALRESHIYQRIGRLTRELHDSFATFCEDTRVSAIAHEEMPNARERLQHVITLTQDSAEKTLTAVEQCIPLAQAIGERAETLSARWTKFRERRLAVDEFRVLSTELETFLASTRNDADNLHAGLSDVLMAQEFQDLTGQMIQRVIALVSEVEEKLVAIIDVSAQPASETDRSSRRKLEGPAVPAIKSADMVNGQDEVDDLLSSLGF